MEEQPVKTPQPAPQKPGKKRSAGVLWVLRQLGVRYFEHSVARSAAALAYYLLFSLFPLLIFLNSAIAMLDLSLPALLDQLNAVLPADVQGIIGDYLRYISGLNSSTLLYAGLFLTVWMLTRSIGMLESAVQRAYHVEGKNFFYLVTVPVVSVLLLLSIFAVLVLVMVSGNLLAVVDQYIRLPQGFIRLWELLRRAVAPAYLFCVLAAFYALAGGGKHRVRRALPGALFALAGWALATWGFSFYVANMGRYSLLYGSLGAIIVLMLWLDLTGNVLILGGELNDILANRKKEEPTP